MRRRPNSKDILLLAIVVYLLIAIVASVLMYLEYTTP